jgi:hypothetical protein
MEDRQKNFEDRLQEIEYRQRGIEDRQKRVGPALQRWTTFFKRAMEGRVQTWMREMEVRGQQKFLGGVRS